MKKCDLRGQILRGMASTRASATGIGIWATAAVQISSDWLGEGLVFVRDFIKAIVHDMTQ